MKSLSVLLMLSLALIFGGVSSAYADAEFTLNLGTLATKDTPWGKQLKGFKKRVESASGDRIKVRIHYGGRKGDEKSMVRQLKRGALQGFGGSTGAMASVVPEMAIFELPYLFKSEKQADKIIDGVLTPEIDKLLSANGYKLYIMAENGFRNFAAKGVAIHGPADLAKLKMRSQELWVHAETYRAAGGDPIQKPVSEVTSALTTGNINGFDNTPLFASAYGWIDQVDTWTVSDHIYQPGLIVYNKEWFDSLPADLQAVVMADQEVETKLGRKLVRRMNKKLMKQLAAKEGMTIYKMTDAEKAAMAKATLSVHKMFVDKVGGEAKRLLDLVNAAK